MLPLDLSTEILTRSIWEITAKMKVTLLCLCLASTAFAAPSFFHYLPHYTGSRQVAPSQALPHAGAYSVELIYPHTFGGAAAGGATAGQFSTQGFIKYSIPQPPGRQSVEVYYPYDFAQQRIITNMPPMSNVPQNPNVLPFDFPPQNMPLPPQNIPTFDAMPLPSQDPLNQAQQDQPIQTSQAPAKV